MLTKFVLRAAAFVGLYVYRRLQRGAGLALGSMAAPAPIRAAVKRSDWRAQPSGHACVSITRPVLCGSGRIKATARRNKHGERSNTVPTLSSQKTLHANEVRAPDIAPWFLAQGGGATSAFQCLTIRLKQLDHGQHFDKFMRVLGTLTAPGTKGLPHSSKPDTLGALARIFLPA
jgi:hypothetical protein